MYLCYPPPLMNIIYDRNTRARRVLTFDYQKEEPPGTDAYAYRPLSDASMNPDFNSLHS